MVILMLNTNAAAHLWHEGGAIREHEKVHSGGRGGILRHVVLVLADSAANDTRREGDVASIRYRLRHSPTWGVRRTTSTVQYIFHTR